jgi:hypothetical protein
MRKATCRLESTGQKGHAHSRPSSRHAERVGGSRSDGLGSVKNTAPVDNGQWVCVVGVVRCWYLWPRWRVCVCSSVSTMVSSGLAAASSLPRVRVSGRGEGIQSSVLRISHANCSFWVVRSAEVRVRPVSSHASSICTVVGALERPGVVLLCFAC